MRLPLSWLNEYVDISDISVEDLKNGLFSCGFEVEEVIEINKNVNKIVTCKLLEKGRHPDADKLFVCKVDAGKYGILQIVTNATNVQVGDIVPVAVNGAILADGTQIKNGKLRGVESFGMFCGGEEIGITEEYYDGASGDSVLIFKDQFPLGEEVADLLDIRDVVFDISVTANRPDCQSVLGLAREVAALLNKPLIMPDLTFKTSTTKTIDKIKVSVLDSELCSRYIANYVGDIKLMPSPKWMQRRLYLMGIRAINNVVDITNYVLNEIGQPMHAFDYRELAGGEIVVRRAKENESITTLDEKTFKLSNNHLVICDKDKPSCLAGIMGGLGSGIKDDTKEIVFESARFKRDNIRKTSRELSQRSDSSARFEKGVDAYTTEIGMKRALHLIDVLGVGTIASESIDVNTVSTEKKVIKTSIDKINKLLGIVVPNDKIVEILNSLQFEVSVSGDNLTVLVPLYREDVEDYPDLAEEIIRMYGYDHIDCKVLKNAEITYGGRNPEQVKENDLKNYLSMLGFNEIVTYSFISPKDYADFSYNLDEMKVVRLKNPLGEDVSIMRTTLLPSIVQAVIRNINKKNNEGMLYELAKVYIPKALPLKELPEEKLQLSLAMFGGNKDFFSIKGVIEGLLNSLGYDKKIEYLPSTREFMHPTRSAELMVDGVSIGYFGQLNPLLGEKLGVDKPMYVGEIFYNDIKNDFTRVIYVKNFSKFPTVERDIALVCDDSLTHGEIVNTINGVGIKNLTDIKLFDIYKGENIASDKKSLAYRLTFSSMEKTLSEEEIENYIRKILKRLETIGAKLR